MEITSKCISIFLICTIILISTKSVLAKPPKHWNIKFDRFVPLLELGEQKTVKFSLINLNKTELTESSAEIRAVSSSDVLRAYKEISLLEIEGSEWHGSVEIEAIFIGASNLTVEIVRPNNKELTLERSRSYMPIQVIRKKVPKWMYKETYTIFEYTMSFIIRMIFGMVIDWNEVIYNLRYPYGIGISFLCTYLLMPLVSSIC